MVALAVGYVCRAFAFYPETLFWALVPVVLMLTVGRCAEVILLHRKRMAEILAYEMEE